MLADELLTSSACAPRLSLLPLASWLPSQSHCDGAVECGRVHQLNGLTFRSCRARYARPGGSSCVVIELFTHPSDCMCPPVDGHPAPLDSEAWVVLLLFGLRANGIGECESVSEILESDCFAQTGPEASLSVYRSPSSGSVAKLSRNLRLLAINNDELPSILLLPRSI